MRHILVTGGNKGIGLAICQAILEHDEHTRVILGSRDSERGEAAINRLLEVQGGWRERLMLLPLDVSDDLSVQAAVQAVAASINDGAATLYGIVNNAGIGFGSKEPGPVLEVNVRGIHRVCQAFLPLLDPTEGRVVNITSAAGPRFVSECQPGLRQFLTDPAIEWPRLDAFMADHIDPENGTLTGDGLDNSDAYGFSKACANTYTLNLARENPHLAINACTPGWIDTDLTHSHAVASGKTPEELGMKPPSEGTRSALHLLFAPLAGNGWYYGSDAVRSPIDAYRGPGDPPYTGP